MTTGTTTETTGCDEVLNLQVTHQRCVAESAAGARHHLVPRRDGRVAGQPAFVQACTFCGVSEGDLGAQIAARHGFGSYAEAVAAHHG